MKPGTDTYKRMIKGNVKRVLEYFASKEYQEEVWGDNPKNKLCFPTEFVEWFDDTGMRDGDFSEQELSIIKPYIDFFYRTFDENDLRKFDGKEHLLLTFEPWLEIRKRAQETLDKLNELGWSEIDVNTEPYEISQENKG